MDIAERLTDHLNRNRGTSRIKYHKGLPTPKKSWKDYYEIITRQGVHQRDEYPHTTYVHFVHGDKESRYSRLIAIQYWFIYFYNDWKASHAGDWEHIVVFLKEPARDADGEPEPVACAYSAHHGGYRLAWRHVERVDDLGNRDRTQAATHPVVYVANASHANYYFGPSRYATSTRGAGG